MCHFHFHFHFIAKALLVRGMGLIKSGTPSKLGASATTVAYFQAPVEKTLAMVGKEEYLKGRLCGHTVGAHNSAC